MIKIGQMAPLGKKYRVSSDSAWPLRSSIDGKTFAERRRDQIDGADLLGADLLGADVYGINLYCADLRRTGRPLAKEQEQSK